MELKNKVAVVTGAGSGIGRALAKELASQGCHLALADINGKGLAETAESLAGKQLNVSTHQLDVANKTAVHDFADAVVAEHGHLDVVINNAGVQCNSTIEDIGYDDFEWLINIDMWGVVYGSKAFLPYLKQRPQACLVNISSINSSVPFERGGPYNMAKAAIQALSETLMIELADTNVNILSVHPGGIQTNIANSSRHSNAEAAKVFNNMVATTAEKAAADIAKAIRKEHAWLYVGKDAKALQALKRICPRLALKASRAIMARVYKATRKAVAA